MEISKPGRWASLFGANTSFAHEIAQAREIAHQWVEISGQATILLDHIPGWLEPLWAFDGKWLYIRRPEGVWKIRPPSSRFGSPLILRHKTADGPPIGNAYIGQTLARTTGWMRGALEAVTPDELDQALSAEGYGVDADEVGDPLVRAVENTAERYVFSAGDLFGSPPELSVRDNWIIGVDAQSGRTVAFQFRDAPVVRQALANGRLCLRFYGPFLDPFTVHVPRP